MTDRQAGMIRDAIVDSLGNIVHGPLSGHNAQPMGLEAITMALVGGFGNGNGDSVACGLHDIASAIRELSESISADRTQKK